MQAVQGGREPEVSQLAEHSVAKPNNIGASSFLSEVERLFEHNSRNQHCERNLVRHSASKLKLLRSTFCREEKMPDLARSAIGPGKYNLELRRHVHKCKRSTAFTKQSKQYSECTNPNKSLYSLLQLGHGPTELCSEDQVLRQEQPGPQSYILSDSWDSQLKTTFPRALRFPTPHKPEHAPAEQATPLGSTLTRKKRGKGVLYRSERWGQFERVQPSEPGESTIPPSSKESVVCGKMDRTAKNTVQFMLNKNSSPDGQIFYKANKLGSHVPKGLLLNYPTQQPAMAQATRSSYDLSRGNIADATHYRKVAEKKLANIGFDSTAARFQDRKRGRFRQRCFIQVNQILEPRNTNAFLNPGRGVSQVKESLPGPGYYSAENLWGVKGINSRYRTYI